MLTVRFLYNLPILTPPLPARSLLSLLWNQAEPSDPIPEYWDRQLDAMRGSLWFKRWRVAYDIYDGCGMQTNRPISPVMIPEGWTIQRQVSYLLPWVQRVLYLASGCKHSSPRSLSRRTELHDAVTMLAISFFRLGTHQEFWPSSAIFRLCMQGVFVSCRGTVLGRDWWNWQYFEAFAIIWHWLIENRGPSWRKVCIHRTEEPTDPTRIWDVAEIALMALWFFLTFLTWLL